QRTRLASEHRTCRSFMAQSSLAIHGAAGRMGRRLIALGSADQELRLVAAVDSPTHPELGKDAGLLAGIRELGLPLTASLGAAKPDSLIDFSVPIAAETVTDICTSHKIPLV